MDFLGEYLAVGFVGLVMTFFLGLESGDTTGVDATEGDVRDAREGEERDGLLTREEADLADFSDAALEEALSDVSSFDRDRSWGWSQDWPASFEKDEMGLGSWTSSRSKSSS